MEGIYILENEKLLLQVSTKGAQIITLKYKPYARNILSKEMEHSCPRGRIFGKTYNQCFTFKDNKYQIESKNDYMNKIWRLQDSGINYLQFLSLTKDKEDGFPGNVRLFLRYELEKNKLKVETKLFAFENAIASIAFDYGFKIGEDAKVKLNANDYLMNDEYGYPIERYLNVDGTRYDFREAKKINGEYSNYFVPFEKGFRKQAEIQTNDLCLSISSDMPVIRFKKHKNDPYIYLNPSYVENSMNMKYETKPVIPYGGIVDHHIVYTFNEV